MESVTSARFYFTAMCISLYFHWHHWTRESKTMASLQLCHAQLIGVIVLWLLSKCNRSSPFITIRHQSWGGFTLGSRCLFPSDQSLVGLWSRRGKCAGRRWQVASSHQSWRDGGCDILNLNNLHPNNTSPHAAVKCGSWLHVSLMPPPPTSFHNSAAPEKLQRVAAQLGDTRDAVEGDGGKGWRDSKEREEARSVKVRENPQVTASVWLFHHLVPVGLKTWPTLLRSCQRLSTVPLVPRKDNKLFTLCCVLLCAKYCSFPDIFSWYFHTLLLSLCCCLISY